MPKPSILKPGMRRASAAFNRYKKVSITRTVLTGLKWVFATWVFVIFSLAICVAIGWGLAHFISWAWSIGHYERPDCHGNVFCELEKELKIGEFEI